jgi:hypothetical protein
MKKSLKTNATTKKERTQEAHIKAPVVDKSGETTKESKVFKKVDARELKKSGRTEARPVKLKRGK